MTNLLRAVASTAATSASTMQQLPTTTPVEFLEFIDPTCDMTMESSDPMLKAASYRSYNKHLVTIGIPIVVIVGLLGNLSFLFVVCRLKAMRTITNFYLANLAVSDIIVLISASVQYFGSYYYSAPLDVNLIGFTFRSPLGCAIPNLLNYTCYFASLWFVTLVATERFLAICHPFKHRMISGKGRTFRLVVCTWILSFTMGAFAAPYAGTEVICITSGDYEDDNDGPFGRLPRRISRCMPLCYWCDLVLWALDSIQFFVAVLTNTAMYGFIIYILSVRTISVNGGETNGCLSQESTRLRNQEHRDNIARMLSVNAVVFFISLTPYAILNLNSLFDLNFDRHHTSTLDWVAKMAYLTNSAVNPFIYSGVNRRYRQAFLVAFGFVNIGARDASHHHTSSVSVRSTRGGSMSPYQNETLL